MVLFRALCSGTGKTHIATALGIQTVEHNQKKVRVFATVDLVTHVKAAIYYPP